MRRLLSRLTGDSLYVLIGFPLAATTFCLVLTGVVAGAGLWIVWIGLPILALTMLVARGMGDAERLRISRMLAVSAYLRS
ncbi:sensor domain-containing protein [Sphaerimonospora sp. CA-214678]|uniref:sensor domain-containing protein n=1 Tax=Sphaerimonospora sp. CA-214678 TaxID=3240029 RepID=UPI003D9446DE